MIILFGLRQGGQLDILNILSYCLFHLDRVIFLWCGLDLGQCGCGGLITDDGRHVNRFPFGLFLLLELFVQAVEFLHFLDPQPVFLLGGQFMLSLFNDGFAGDLRGLRSSPDFVNDVRVDVVFKGRRVELFESVLDFLLRSKFQEILKTVPLVVVDVYR
jgi:hypothetical protein